MGEMLVTNLLQSGQVVQASLSVTACTVGRCLGGGGQGEVYQVDWRGTHHALKWYFKQTATEEQLASLQKLLKDHYAPSEDFLWPMELCSSSDVPGFGYLMRLREPRFKGLLDLVTGRINPSFCTLVTAGLRYADNFFKLHAQGLCYRDISFGNAFFDPTTGDIAICDNDNVTENGNPNATVLGTADFMAPEIVRGESVPTRKTDLYSLAVLLFYMFHIHHPLYGKKLLDIHNWDLKAREKLLGREPVFIFDPQDSSNEAVDKSRDPLGEAGANALVFWPIYPQVLRDAFIRSFTSGLCDPEHGRVTEGEWRRVLSQTRDALYYCIHCGAENFYDHAASTTSGGRMPTCWSCKEQLRLPFRIRIDRAVVMLHHDAKLYSHHLESKGDYDFDVVVGEVVQNPRDASVWGLKNLTSKKWVATTPDGAYKDVDPGKSVVLKLGTKVNFGTAEGEIRY